MKAATIPTVSVLIPAYNAERTIGRALDSVWRQNWPIKEVIVVDDASTDGTVEAVRRHTRPELRLIRLDRNRGECGAMNEGIAVATGDLIAFLDADDEWLGGKLAVQVPIMAERLDLTLVACRYQVQFADGSTGVFGWDQAFSGPEGWRALLRRSVIAKPCVVARRSTLVAVGAFDETLKVAGDQDMWIRLALRGSVESLPDILVRTYQTAGSLMTRYAKREIEYALPMIERHLVALGHRLDERERRHILVERLSQWGRNSYGNGCIRDGVRLLARAVWLGDELGKNLWFLFTAAPPVRRLKRLIGHEAA